MDTAHIHFVTVDFDEEPWLDVLERRGFQPGLPTFFLWEGVVYYLDPESVAATLEAVGTRCAPGSCIAFDYFGSFALGEEGPWLLRAVAQLVRFTGEPWRFAISTRPPARERVAELLAAHGLKLERYEPRGEEAATGQPFGGLVHGVVPGEPRDAGEPGA